MSNIVGAIAGDDFLDGADAGHAVADDDQTLFAWPGGVHVHVVSPQISSRPMSSTSGAGHACGCGEGEVDAALGLEVFDDGELDVHALPWRRWGRWRAGSPLRSRATEISSGLELPARR